MTPQMKQLKIDKGKLAGFLDELRKGFRVVAPVEKEGLVLFEEIGSGGDALLDFANSRQSPKELFFPQAEVLFSYEFSDGELQLEEPPPEPRKTVIFGMRPCDAKAVLLLDKVFLQGDCEDPNYSRRRDNTIILALGCTHPRSTCFCTSLGGGPFSEQGVDALFVDIGDSYIVEVLTPKGEELFKDSKFAEADEDSIKRAEEVKKRAEALIGSEVEAKRAADLELSEVFESTFWDRVHEKCLGCGICTYLCPTCSCFDVVDEKTDSGGERIRIWDPCLFPLYTLQASGFNPRSTGKGRMRQRILHKFKYSPDSYGEPSCVGCGRCIVSCPVNLDIRQVVNSLVGGEG
jgi:ferredoxin